MYKFVRIPFYTSWIVVRGIAVSGVDLFPGYGFCALQYSRGRIQGSSELFPLSGWDTGAVRHRRKSEPGRRSSPYHFLLVIHMH